MTGAQSRRRFLLTWVVTAPLIWTAGCGGATAANTIQFTKSFLTKADYRADTRALTVRFTDGSSYEYENVPRVTFDQWRASGLEAGQFFNSSIREKFMFRRLSPPAPSPRAAAPAPAPQGARGAGRGAAPRPIACSAQIPQRTVKSTVLNAVAYDRATRCLVLYFDSGHVYRYRGVPPEAYANLLRPGEPGIYFNKSIRNQFTAELVRRPGRAR